MTTAEFLSHLRSLNVKLCTDGGRLRCEAPKTVLTPEFQAELKRRKSEILRVLGEDNCTGVSNLSSIRDGSRDGDIPLSFSQQRLWFLTQLEPDKPIYNESMAFRLTGVLNIAALQMALNAIIARHETLRTTFASVDGLPIQVVSNGRRLDLEITDLSHIPVPERDATTQRLLREIVQQPFDLSSALMLRASLIKHSPQECVLLFVMHHIAIDGWSCGVLFQEIATLYQAFRDGQPYPLAELPIQYADFAIWQRDYMQKEILEQHLSYWRQRLAGIPVLQLPTDHPRPAVQSHRGAYEVLLMPKTLTEEVKALSRQEGVTLFMVLLTAFKVLLHRYSGQDDIVVGSPFMGRTHRETEKLIGYFTDVLVLRTDLSGDPTFREVLHRVREVALGAYNHPYIPFENLSNEIGIERTRSLNALFQVMFVLLNVPINDFRIPGLEVSPIAVHHAGSKFDLGLTALERPEGLGVSLEYSTDLFDDSTAKRLLRQFQRVLERILENPARPISEMPLLTHEEKQRLLIEWNDTKKDYPNDKCVHVLFEEQVKRTSEAVAVVHEDKQLTYGELNTQANRLAHYLQKCGVGPEVLVGICMERCPGMIVGLLGILKAGGAYVPLDPALPKERLAFILEDANVPVLLTQQGLVERLPKQGTWIISLDNEGEVISQYKKENPETGANGQNLAYVIYTSGSTGRPKGVVVTHQALVNFTNAAQKMFALRPDDRILQFASIGFDTAVEEIFPALVSGASLVLRTDAMLSSAATFLQKCRDWGVTVWDLPTAYWHQLTTELESAALALPEQWRLVIIGGEQALPTTVTRWRQCASEHVRLLNTYGPTEATVVATSCDLTDFPEADAKAPIGRPITNVQVYVLDQRLRPVPIGVVGELYIGGAGVARGYLNRTDWTAENFIPDPFSGQSGGRLYRTGDSRVICTMAI